MSGVVVSLLGRFRVETEGEKLCFPTRKAESLLACLILHPQGLQRVQLASLLWPDTEDELARRNLRATLWRLRRSIDGCANIRVQSNEGKVTLLHAGVEVDVIRFEELLREAQDTVEKRLEFLRLAESIYKGDLLEDRSEEWCEEERRHLRNSYAGLLKELTEISKAAGENVMALRYARKAVEMEPLDEDANRELMILLHLAGRRAEALAQFEILRQLLRRELDVSPSQATLQAWLHIRSHPNAERSESAPIGLADRASSTRSESIPLVGRADLASDLFRSIEDAARGSGGAAVISGEAGIGKTKFVEFVVAEAGLRGFDVLYGQCPDLQNPRPYQVFVQALWQRICESLRVEGTAPPLNVLLNALVSDSLPKNSAHPTGASSIASDSAMIVEAFLSLLNGRDSPRPILLVLEDIHRIDRASANLLITLLGRLSKQRLFVLATIRSDESEGRSIISQLIAGGAREVQIQPLTEGEVGKLLRLALNSSSVARPVINYLWERSGGVPLFALEFLRYLQAEGMIASTPEGHWLLSKEMKAVEASGEIPSRVQEIIRRRIESLDPAAKRVLLTASVSSNEVHFEVLKELVGISEESFVDTIDRLVGLRFFRQTERGYQFSHELVRLVATAIVGKAYLRVMHGRAGRLLERREPWRSEELAWHFEMAGEAENALGYAEESGDKARSVHANADAAAWYSRALKFHDESHSGTAQYLRVRARILQKRQEVLDLLGDRDKQAADIAAIQTIAQQLGDRRLLAESLNLRGNLLIRLNASGDALKCARLARRYFRKIGDVGGVARSHETAGLAYDNLRRYSPASAEFDRAQEMFRRAGDKAGEARSLSHIGLCLYYSSRLVAALKCFDRAEGLLETLGDRRNLAMLCVRKGMLHRFAGQLETSQSLILRGVSVFQEIGDRIGEARALNHLAATHASMGLLRDAVRECETALSVARQAGDVRALVMILNNSAVAVHRLTGGLSRAQRYVCEALRLVSEAGNVENSATYEDSMAAVLLDAGRTQEALRWAERSKARYVALGARSWIGVDVHFRLGSILAELGQPRQALRYFQRAQRHLGEDSDPVSDLLITTAMARVFLRLDNLKAAARYERRIANLLRRVDGVERIQEVYWNQYRVLQKTGRHRAASRALRRAVTTVVRQAGTLKKPMRKRFLAMPLNAMIIREFWSSNRSLGVRATPNLGAEEIVDVLSKSLGTGSSAVVSPAESVVAARRRVVLGLVQRERVKQRELAGRLGVSVRTVRNDITELRKQGLLEIQSAT